MFHCSHHLFAHLIKGLGLNCNGNLNLKLKHKETEIASDLFKGKSIDVYFSQKITGLQQLMESNSFLSNVFQPAFDLDEFLSDPLSQSGIHHNAVKGGLISESFSLWLYRVHHVKVGFLN